MLLFVCNSIKLKKNYSLFYRLFFRSDPGHFWQITYPFIIGAPSFPRNNLKGNQSCRNSFPVLLVHPRGLLKAPSYRRDRNRESYTISDFAQIVTVLHLKCKVGWSAANQSVEYEAVASADRSAPNLGWMGRRENHLTRSTFAAA